VRSALRATTYKSCTLSPPTSSGSVQSQIRMPDGTVVPLDSNQRTFTETTMPGIYAIESLVAGRLFAVVAAHGVGSHFLGGLFPGHQPAPEHAQGEKVLGPAGNNTAVAPHTFA